MVYCKNSSLLPLNWLVVFILGFVALFLFGYSYNNEAKYVAIQGGNNYYKSFIDKELAIVDAEIVALRKCASEYGEAKTLKQLQHQVEKTRIAYKRIEGVASYYFPEHIKAYINGAPLDHLAPLLVNKETKTDLGFEENYKNYLPLDLLEAGSRSRTNDNVIEPPLGLQRIDELVFSDEAKSSKTEIIELTNKLRTAFYVLKESLNYRKFYHDFEVIESSRLELIRILSMGITGFDTPGSLNALKEASSSLYGIEEVLEPLIKKCSQKKQQEIEEIFIKAQQFLSKHDNFITFDRLVFIKSYINPLYKSLWDIQQELKIESSASKFNKTPSWNSDNKNIFGNDFLNPYYYSILKENEDSPELQQLGKKLFFDKQLSHDNNISCASCHKPELGYADGEITSVSGLEEKRVNRNSPTLINSVFSDRYFYDLRAYDLEDQAGHVIEDHLEFNTSFDEIITKLNKDEAYKKAFQKIYKTQEINRYQFSTALASFVISLRSFNSPFDKYMRDEIKDIDKNVKRGFNLFMGKANCATCHYAPTFSGLVPPLYNENETEVLGVLQSPGSFTVDGDQGRFNNGVSQDQQNIFNRSFKTTTVRNSALTAPYFHNGAYNTLEEVIGFYNTGGAAGLGLSYEVPNQTLPPDHLRLSKSEIRDITAFIKSLTDVPK